MIRLGVVTREEALHHLEMDYGDEVLGDILAKLDSRGMV